MTMVRTAEAQPEPIEVSDVLPAGAKAGPWIVERELGRGGMGAVYAVVHEEIGKRAALKILHARLLTPGFNGDRMLLEARVVNQVGHPNIVDIFETGELADGRPYIVMERLEGQSLAHRADASKIPSLEVIAILLQVCDALIAAHAAGIVHRDLKLDNVFLVDHADDPRAPHAKLLDWGIAKVINHDVKHTIDGQLVGTPQYLAPEQARGDEVSGQTDVYSLGVMAYELFLEQLPFEAETSAEIMVMHLRATPPPASDLWPGIPCALEDLLHAMLAKSPAHRPTMIEVAQRLEAVRGELVQQASNVTTIAALPRVARRISSAGLAACERPRRDGAKRWQYVAGVLAIVASATMFLISRTGDSAAATATPLAIRADLTAVAASPARAPTTPPNMVAFTPMTVVTRAAHIVRPSPAPRASTQRSTPTVHRSSSRRAPVTPRRATKLDPDGTFDPYR